MIKNGTRLQSQVCDTQVIVVRSADSLDDLRAGGAPMVPIGDEVTAGLSHRRRTVRRHPDGQALRRRRRRRGAGHQGGRGHAVASASTPLAIKEAKPLPASD